jgi:NAD(P)-dependent dehydrogenase (short-subunit alcohol dehydrogenase family)
VCEASSVEALVNATIKSYGRLDCACNNAGISGDLFKTVVEQSEESWDRVVATNLKGVWLSMKYEIPAMLRCGGGSIVNTASMYALAGADFDIRAFNSTAVWLCFHSI